MIAGLVWMVVANAAVLLAARVAVRRCGTGRPAVDLILFLLFRFAFIMALVLATGMAGWMTPLGLGLPCAALLAALLARGERLDAPWNAALPREIPRVILVFLVAFASRFLIQALLYLPIDGDATSYHLPKVAEWARSGRLLVDLGNDPRSWFPAGFELVEAWWVIFLHHDVLIELAGLEFLLLAGASAWALAGWLKLGPNGSMIAALTLVSMPGFAVQAISGLNDAPAAALVLAGAALIAHRAPPALLVFLGGIAAGVKPTAAYAVPGLLLLMWLVRKEPASSPAPRSWTWLAAGLGLALGAFWYARTWILTGNPVYPLGTSAIIGETGKELQRVGLNLSSLSKNFTDLVNYRLYDHRRPYHPLLEHAAAWGPAVVSCGLPALVWAARSSSRMRMLAAGFATSLGCVLALVVNDRFNLRFILWFPALPALGLGWAVERYRRLLIPSVLTLACTFVATMFYSHYSLRFVSNHLRQDGWTQGALWIFNLPDELRVGTYGTYGPRSYLLYRPDFRAEVIPIRAASAEALRHELTSRGLRILYGFSVNEKSPEGLVLKEALRQGWLKQLREGVYFLKKS